MAQCEGPAENGDSCEKEAERAGLCRGHRKQKTRGERLSPLEPRGQTKRALLVAAALDLANCTSEDDERWQRLLGRLEKIASRRFLSRSDRVPANTDAA